MRRLQRARDRRNDVDMAARSNPCLGMATKVTSEGGQKTHFQRVREASVTFTLPCGHFTFYSELISA